MKTQNGRATGATKPRRLRLQEKWDSYRREVVPSSASHVQIVELRRAFYAGAQTFAGLAMNAPDDPKAEAQYADELGQELRDFPEREIAEGHGL